MPCASSRRGPNKAYNGTKKFFSGLLRSRPVKEQLSLKRNRQNSRPIKKPKPSSSLSALPTDGHVQRQGSMEAFLSPGLHLCEVAPLTLPGPLIPSADVPHSSIPSFCSTPTKSSKTSNLSKRARQTYSTSPSSAKRSKKDILPDRFSSAPDASEVPPSSSTSGLELLLGDVCLMSARSLLFFTERMVSIENLLHSDLLKPSSLPSEQNPAVDEVPVFQPTQIRLQLNATDLIYWKTRSAIVGSIANLLRKKADHIDLLYFQSLPASNSQLRLLLSFRESTIPSAFMKHKDFCASWEVYPQRVFFPMRLQSNRSSHCPSRPVTYGPAFCNEEVMIKLSNFRAELSDLILRVEQSLSNLSNLSLNKLPLSKNLLAPEFVPSDPPMLASHVPSSISSAPLPHPLPPVRLHSIPNPISLSNLSSNNTPKAAPMFSVSRPSSCSACKSSSFPTDQTPLPFLPSASKLQDNISSHASMPSLEASELSSPPVLPDTSLSCPAVLSHLEPINANSNLLGPSLALELAQASLGSSFPPLEEIPEHFLFNFSLLQKVQV